MAILLTGGAGYIGSHCYYQFQNSNQELIVLDNLSTGFRENLPEDCVFIEGDVGNKELLDTIFKKHNIDVVVHFAGSLIVEESVYKPDLYYKNNVFNTLNLLEACRANNINKIIFSSTASVYGSNPKQIMTEDEPYSPENPYAKSKMMVEELIKDYNNAYDLNYIILRYFNVAGADPDLRVGQRGDNATHLIKVGLELATEKRDEMTVFGEDYPTRDGTCIRDYIHVSDLALAHYKAVNFLLANDEVSEIFNCGYGTGYTVKEVMGKIESIIGKKLNIKMGSRRPGDPCALVANSSKIADKLNWQPQYNSLDTIIQTALAWEKEIQ